MSKQRKKIGATRSHSRVAWIISSREIHRRLLLEARDALGAEPVIVLGDVRMEDWAREHLGTGCCVPGNRNIKNPPFHFAKQVSGTVFETYATLVQDPLWRIWEPILLLEANRLPDFDTLLLDREARLRLILLRLLEIFENQRPEYLVMTETPHGPVNLVAFVIARWLGLPCLFFQPTSTIGPSIVARVDLDTMMFPAGVQTEASFADSPPSTLWRQTLLHSSLKRFKAGGQPARIEAEMAEEQRRKRTIMSPTRFILPGRPDRLKWRRRLKSAFQLIPLFHNDAAWQKKTIDLFYSEQRSRFASEAGQITNAVEDLQLSAVFPLHYQPERTSIPEGPLVPFQGDVVAAARAILPDEISLVVKEHPSQVSSLRKGYLGRSVHTHRLIGAFPNTHFVGPKWPLTDHLATQKVCFTLTGSVGIQAALLGVPVVYFGNPWWEGMPGAIRFNPDLSWGEVSSLSGAFTAEEVEDFLDHLVSSRSFPGFVNDSHEKFWKSHESLPEDWDIAEFNGLRFTLSSFLERSRTEYRLPTTARVG